MAPSSKTIIALDSQLYAKALKLQRRNKIGNNFVFLPGELHIVFAFQHAIGKYIENSGLNQSFIDCDIYRPVTVNQILNGKHMKKGLEAYMVLYLALNKNCLKDFSKIFPETLKSIESSLKSFYECFNILNTTKTYGAELLLRNYLRKIPEYIAQMRNIKIYEEETWRFFENGNFFVNRNHFPFSVIGTDHDIEQLNR